MASKNSQDLSYPEITKISNYLYLGSCEHPILGTDQFKELNFDVIINCASNEVQYTDVMEKKYVIENFPLEDNEYASLLEHLDAINDALYRHLKSHKKIYLHCVRGISRAPAVLIYYLMSYKKYTYEDALHAIKVRRSVIDIHPNFERELITIEEDSGL